METMFLKDALFGGMTSNAFKLGTVLTLGWFWTRVLGCSVLYRGLSMDTVDFDSILTIGEYNTALICPPDYLAHEIDAAYFYIVRKVNGCGNQEHTLAAAVKVVIDSEGNLAEPYPNGIFKIKTRQVAGNKVELIWFYNPFRQKAKPGCFNIYYDNGTGQIDYQNKLSTISYKGKKFYGYTTDTLGENKYLFAIRAEGFSGNENESLTQVMVDVSGSNPIPVNILNTESI